MTARSRSLEENTTSTVSCREQRGLPEEKPTRLSDGGPGCAATKEDREASGSLELAKQLMDLDACENPPRYRWLRQKSC